MPLRTTLLVLALMTGCSKVRTHTVQVLDRPGEPAIDADTDEIRAALDAVAQAHGLGASADDRPFVIDGVLAGVSNADEETRTRSRLALRIEAWRDEDRFVVEQWAQWATTDPHDWRHRRAVRETSAALDEALRARFGDRVVGEREARYRASVHPRHRRGGA